MINNYQDSEIKSYNNPELNIYLNDKEINNLKYLEKKANLSNLSEKKNSDLLNKSINEIISDWSKNNIDILSDLVLFFDTFDKYTKFFEDLDESKNILDGINTIMQDIFIIFTKDERSIYFGFTLIFISLIFYFIGISS